MEWLIFGGILLAAAILRDANRKESQPNDDGNLEGNRVHRDSVTGDGGNRDPNSPGTVNRVGDVIPPTVPAPVSEPFSIVRNPPEKFSPQPPPEPPIAAQPQ